MFGLLKYKFLALPPEQRHMKYPIHVMRLYKSADLSISSHSCKPCSSWTYQNSFDRSTTSWLQANNEASFLGPIASRKH